MSSFLPPLGSVSPVFQRLLLYCVMVVVVVTLGMVQPRETLCYTPLSHPLMFQESILKRPSNGCPVLLAIVESPSLNRVKRCQSFSNSAIPFVSCDERTSSKDDRLSPRFNPFTDLWWSSFSSSMWSQRRGKRMPCSAAFFIFQTNKKCELSQSKASFVRRHRSHFAMSSWWEELDTCLHTNFSIKMKAGSKGRNET